MTRQRKRERDGEKGRTQRDSEGGTQLEANRKAQKCTAGGGLDLYYCLHCCIALWDIMPALKPP